MTTIREEDYVSAENGGQSVLAVAGFFPPMADSGSIRNWKLLKNLPTCGWKLRVLTMRGGNPQADRESGREFDVIRTRCFHTHGFLVTAKHLATFRWLRRSPGQRRRQNGGTAVQTAGAGSPPARSRGLKAIIENLCAIPDKYVGWLPFAVWAGMRSLLRERVDVIYAVGKPWTGLFVGYALKCLFRRPLVIDFMDPWRGSSWSRSKGRFLDGVEDRLERLIVRRADFVIANTEELADDFVQRLEVPRERVAVVTCGYDPDDLVRVQTEALQPNEQFTVTHTGSFYKQRTPLHFLKALRLLLDDGRLAQDVVRVNLVGNLRVNDGELESLLADPRIARVVHRESWVPHTTALQYMRSSDVLLLVQPGTRLQIPAKLYEYAALGRPILALADAGGAVDNLLRREGWGSAVRHDDVERIADEVHALFQTWRDGRLAASGELLGVEAYSYPALAKGLARIFESLTSRETRPATVTETVEAPA